MTSFINVSNELISVLLTSLPDILEVPAISGLFSMLAVGLIVWIVRSFLK